MSKMSHTPGPWVLVDGDRFEKEKVITTKKRLKESYGCICEMDVDFSEQMGIEQEANANLIAAAPDLLEALSNFVAFTEQHGEVVFSGGGMSAIDAMNACTTKARAAIAKATGGAA